MATKSEQMRGNREASDRRDPRGKLSRGYASECAVRGKVYQRRWVVLDARAAANSPIQSCCRAIWGVQQDALVEAEVSQLTRLDTLF
jgi:hypothetical protein